MQKLFTVFLLASCAGRSQVPISEALATGDKAKAEKKWDLALASYTQARSAAQSAGNGKSLSAALSGMAEAEFNLSHYEVAEKLARESLTISDSNADLTGSATALLHLDHILYRQGRSREMKPVLERLLSIQRQLNDRNGVAVALNNLGNLWKDMGDTQQAIEYLSLAEQELSALGNDRSRGVVLNNIGDLYADLGDYARGLEFCYKGLALSQAANDDFHVGTTLNVIGFAESRRGNYREALRVYQLAAEAGKRAGNDWGVAETANNVGLVYQTQQNHPQAIAHFQKALALNQAVGDKSLEAEVSKNLGDEMLASNRFTEATAEFRKSADLAKETASPSMEAEAHRGLGTLLFRESKPAAAEAEFEKAAALQRAIPAPPELAFTYIQLCRLRLKQGRPADALALAQQAIGLLGTIDAPEVLWQAEFEAGLAFERSGRSAEASKAFDASIETIESLRYRVAGPPTVLALYFANKLAPYRERVRMALKAGKTEDALGFAEASKSRALADILQSGRVDPDKSLTVEERAAERHLLNRLVGLNIQIRNQPEEARLKTQRDAARRDLEALQGDLYARHPEAASQRGESPAIKGAEMAQLAAECNAVILDYLVTESDTYLFVIRRGARTRVVALGAGERDLSARAREFHRQLASHDLGYQVSAEALYRLLVAPAARDLAGARAIVIVPDGPLWDIAFHALEPSPRHFLVEQAAISYAPSLTVLRESMRMARDRRAAPAPRELLALGNPGGQPGLPEAERQVREIGELYGATRSLSLTGFEATQERFKREAGDFRVLHLASHAVLDGANPMYSSALLAPTKGDSGVLEARDLMGMNIRADLLVLSACETARGPAPPGEGINGMLWAAFVAGAPTTVASLWRVESASTSKLMVGFHRNWIASRKSGSSFAKADSLRAAELALIADAKFSHPYYWAGFVTMGSPF